MPIRLLIADDHGVLRAGLRALLNSEPELEVVGEAASGLEALAEAEGLRPDVVLMDISMPDMDGLEATRKLHKSLPEARVLLLTVHEDESLVRAALKAGAAGYITKRAAESELITAIKVVVGGDLYVHPSMMRILLRELAPQPSGASLDEPRLTAREKEVLILVTKGYTNTQIAQKLAISTRTVEGHRASMMDKLGLHSRLELVAYAESHGLRE